MPAASLADVLARDSHPVIALGLRDHRLEESAVHLLDLAAPPQLRLGIAEPRRERVPNPLQLAHVEHPRPSDGTHAPVESLPRKRRGEQRTEPLLEARDLATKIVADPPLGERVDARPRLAEQAVKRL